MFKLVNSLNEKERKREEKKATEGAEEEEVVDTWHLWDWLRGRAAAGGDGGATLPAAGSRRVAPSGIAHTGPEPVQDRTVAGCPVCPAHSVARANIPSRDSVVTAPRSRSGVQWSPVSALLLCGWGKFLLMISSCINRYFVLGNK